MSEQTKITTAHVVVSKRDSEYEHFQALERAAVMIGGDLGHGVLGVLEMLRAGVIERAMGASDG